MRKIWTHISNLGITKHDGSLEVRSNILFNQMNCFTTILWLFILIFIEFERIHYNIGTLFDSSRTFLAFSIGFIVYLLTSSGHRNVAKTVFLIAPSFFFFIYPTLLGFKDIEGVIYNPYIITALSALPQLILIPNTEKRLYISTVAYFTLLICFYDVYIIYFQAPEMESTQIIKKYYANFKMVQMMIFLFVNSSIFYLRKITMQYEDLLTNANKQLFNKNKLLDEQNDELSRINEQLISTQNHLIQAEKMMALGTLTKGVAHEINNPLNYINSGLLIIDEVLENLGNENHPNNKEKISKLGLAYSAIDKGITNASSIVNSLMDFSHGGSMLAVERTIDNVIDSTLLFLKYQMANIKLDLNYDKAKPYLMHPEKMHQILLKILENAIFETNNLPSQFDKKITINTKVKIDTNSQEWMEIAIHNTGQPISTEHLSQIFDPFYSSKQHGEGTGLGLFITYELVMECHGTIQANNCNSGVEFILRFPYILKNNHVYA